jgi:hypothetical protein
MWDINQSFNDSTELSGHVTIMLRANKPLNPYHVSYPIIWTGFINNDKIEITQLSSSSSFMENYEFKTFPINFSMYEGRIVKLIDTCLRRALD